jgi:hypothetical protein
MFIRGEMQSLEGIPTHGILIVHEASFFSRPHEMPWDAHCRFEINSRLTAPSLLLAKIVLTIYGIHAVFGGYRKGGIDIPLTRKIFVTKPLKEADGDLFE